MQQEVVSYGYSDICYLLLKCGALPNTPGEGNRTALHEAAKANRLSEAKLLLKYSANKNVYDDYGKRPMYVLLNIDLLNCRSKYSIYYIHICRYSQYLYKVVSNIIVIIYVNFSSYYHPIFSFHVICCILEIIASHTVGCGIF